MRDCCSITQRHGPVYSVLILQNSSLPNYLPGINIGNPIWIQFAIFLVNCLLHFKEVVFFLSRQSWPFLSILGSKTPSALNYPVITMWFSTIPVLSELCNFHSTATYIVQFDPHNKKLGIYYHTLFFQIWRWERETQA